MDKQHLTATISALLGALVLVLQAAGVHSPNINVNATADSLAGILMFGGTLWAAVVHHNSRKPIPTPVAPVTSAPAPVAPPSDAGTNPAAPTAQ